MAVAPIDPVRLLKKYKWLLVISLLVGAVIGGAAHFVLMRVYPIYEKTAIFEILAPKVDPAEPNVKPDEDELERFMATQVLAMRSETVLQRVVDDPGLMTYAPKWASQFKEKGAVNRNEARRELEDIVAARVMSGSQFIKLGVRWTDAKDVTWLVNRVREEYISWLGQRERDFRQRTMQSIKTQIDGLDTEIKGMQQRREDELKNRGIDSLDARFNEANEGIRLAQEQEANILAALEAYQDALKRYEADASAPGGIRFDDVLRSEVEQQPIVQEHLRAIQALESQLRTLANSGFGTEHVQYKATKAQLDGERAQLDALREQELVRMFNGRLESTRNNIQQFKAQLNEAQARIARYKERASELTQVKKVIEDYDTNIDSLTRQRGELQQKDRELKALQEQATQRDYAERVLYLDRIRQVQWDDVPPDIPVFPTLKIMIPLGVVLIGGLTASGVVLRELLDQRVKSAADVALIPRTRVVGMIPAAANDPSRPKAVETAFRDQPNGVIAEAYRQVRAQVMDRMQKAGHRSLLVVAGMPDSGATSAAINLAMGMAASDRRVLLIDANLRRPAVHRILARAEQPGLVDVLSGSQTLEATIQQTENPNLDVLAVGSRPQRLYERLASEAMGKLMGDATARYDLVIIDTAPAVVSGDAQALAGRCDATLLVVRAFNEKRGLVARVRGQFEESNSEFLGVLVNGVRIAAGGYMKRNIRVTHAYQNKPE
ncbi:MAG: polysaccharide biosynthesis tyrosine autokinase [Phycisphaeraceae bacterium]|nr:polysaccharide biosynthesis tyrosine autokinase [Phycisphaeraceae bacterium]